jgi:hypothetical protein
MTCSMTEDGLSESLQEMDFSGIPSIITARLLVLGWVCSFPFLIIVVIQVPTVC